MSMMKLASCFRRKGEARWLTEAELARLIVDNKQTQTQMTNSKTQKVERMVSDLKVNYRELGAIRPQTKSVVLARQHISAAIRNAEDWIRAQAYPKSKYPVR